MIAGGKAAEALVFHGWCREAGPGAAGEMTMATCSSCRRPGRELSLAVEAQAAPGTRSRAELPGTAWARSRAANCCSKQVHSMRLPCRNCVATEHQGQQPQEAVGQHSSNREPSASHRTLRRAAPPMNILLYIYICTMSEYNARKKPCPFPNVSLICLWSPRRPPCRSCPCSYHRHSRSRKSRQSYCNQTRRPSCRDCGGG